MGRIIGSGDGLVGLRIASEQSDGVKCEPCIAPLLPRALFSAQPPQALCRTDERDVLVAAERLQIGIPGDDEIDSGGCVRRGDRGGRRCVDALARARYRPQNKVILELSV